MAPAADLRISRGGGHARADGTRPGRFGGGPSAPGSGPRVSESGRRPVASGRVSRPPGPLLRLAAAAAAAVLLLTAAPRAGAVSAWGGGGDSLPGGGAASEMLRVAAQLVDERLSAAAYGGGDAGGHGEWPLPSGGGVPGPSPVWDWVLDGAAALVERGLAGGVGREEEAGAWELLGRLREMEGRWAEAVHCLQVGGFVCTTVFRVNDSEMSRKSMARKSFAPATAGVVRFVILLAALSLTDFRVIYAVPH